MMSSHTPVNGSHNLERMKARSFFSLALSDNHGMTTPNIIAACARMFDIG